MRKGPPRQVEAERHARPAVAIEFRQDLGIAGRADDNEHVAEVLGGGADQAGPADVNLLDQIVEGNPRLRRSLDERIEVDAHEIDQADAMRIGRGEVFGMRSAREDAAMNLGVQRLDAAVHHLGKAGDVRHVAHRQAGVGQGPRRPAGGDEFEATLGEAAGKVDEAGFVGNTENRSGHGLGRFTGELNAKA